MSPVRYTGDPALEHRVIGALAGVVDPELALGILDVGLVYAVDVAPERVRVAMTMTSAACPLGDLLADDIERALRPVLADARPVEVALVWEPPWTPDRMSARAREAMGW